MAVPATLTTGLTAALTYTTLHVTAMPGLANAGEILYVGQGTAHVEQFVVDTNVIAGDTILNVVSKVAASNHAIGENVTPKYALTTIGRTMTPTLVPRLKKL